MKILHILDHSIPLHSGYSFRSINIFRNQQKMGYRPVALTSPKQNPNPNEFNALKDEIEGFKHYRTGMRNGPKLRFLQEIQLMTALGRRIFEVVQNEKPDILHAHSPILNAIPALFVGSRMKIPVIYEIRAFWEDAAVDHGTYREKSLKYNTVRYLETWVSRKVACVGILCNGLKKELVNRGVSEKKISVVYNGVDLNNFNGHSDQTLKKKWNLDGKTVIGFVGSFYSYEGLDSLILAFAKVAEQKPNLILLLVGGGQMTEKLIEIVKTLRIQDKVIFTGRISHKRIPRIYGAIDILIYPRYSIRLTELVTPLKPLEALAMKKPVIVSDVGGHREILRERETCLFFKPGNVEHLADRLELLLGNESLCHKLRQNGYNWVKERHSWEKTTSVYRHIYETAKTVTRKGGDAG